MPPPSRRTPPLSELDPLLGPVLARRPADEPANLTALAATCRALDAGVPPHQVRIWLRSRGGNRLATVTATPRAFQPVLSKARAKVASVSSLPARRRESVAVARRLVGSVLSPVPTGSLISPRRQLAARHATAVVGVALLDSIRTRGWDTALISAPWLAVQLGCRPAAARAALHAAVELGWVRVVSARAGAPGRYDLPRLPAARGAVADGLTMTVDALVEDDPSLDETAEILMMAAHPAVGYDIGARAWLVALADTAEVDPTALGIGRGTLRTSRREWWQVVLADDVADDEPLAFTLDRHAGVTGARARRDDAETSRREAAEARRIETATHRERKAGAYAAIDRLLVAHPMPSPAAPLAARNAWVEVLTAAVGAGSPPAEVRPLIARALAGKLMRAGHDPAAAERVASHIAGVEQQEVAS